MSEPRHADFSETDLSTLLDRLKDALSEPTGADVEFRVYRNIWTETWWAAVYYADGADLPFLAADMDENDERPGSEIPRDAIRVEGMVASQTREPAVMLRIGDVFRTMPVAEARQLALWLLSAAEAAEQDAFLIAFAAEEVDADPLFGVALLRQFREYRERWQKGTPS